MPPKMGAAALRSARVSTLGLGEWCGRRRVQYGRRYESDGNPGRDGDAGVRGRRAARSPAGAVGRNRRRPSWWEPGRGNAGRGRGDE